MEAKKELIMSRHQVAKLTREKLAESKEFTEKITSELSPEIPE